MADIKLTCAETPLDWPANVSLDDLRVSKTSGLKLYSPQPGPLQILTRRQGGGVGDGVNIQESNTVGADYRGQRYTLDEVIFHTPGLHIFPNMDKVYPAELHIHMYTNASPKRQITIVIPVSHLANGTVGDDYFAACAARPDPAVTKPSLSSILVPGSKILQYRGPDVRGRTAATPVTDSCDSLDEREFLMILGVTHIRASDLERIPREGSLSTDKRDLPADPIPHASRTKVPRDRLLRIASVASPGLLGSSATTSSSATSPATINELECKPVKVVNGRDVIDEGGKAVDIYTLLGISGETVPEGTDTATVMNAGRFGTMFIGVIMGLLFADWLFGNVWAWFFTGQRVETWEPIKIWIFLSISIGAGATAAAFGSS
jgi:hypothetical protein